MKARGMIMIGAADRGDGGPALACSLIRRFAPLKPIVAVGATEFRGCAKDRPRGAEGGGAGSNLASDFQIAEACGESRDELLSRRLQVGAARALWLRYREEAIEPAATALLEQIGPGKVVVCESNGLRTQVEPDLFLMVRHASAPEFDPAAADVRRFAARVIPFTSGRLELDLDEIQLDGRRWRLQERAPLQATAVILAGGQSSRMGEDKSLLPIDGKPMIQRLCEVLSETCDEVMIGANDPERFAFLQVPVVRDRESGQGPLMAIASALDRAKHELCFVSACDLPNVEPAAVQRLLREANGFDAAVPMTRDGFLEPLHAVYRKTFLPAADAVLAAGGRKVSDGIERARVNYVRDFSESELHNLNTRGDYEAYLRAKARKA